MTDVQQRTGRAVALVGPGRAGTTVVAALVARGGPRVAVAGRAPDAASTHAGRRATRCCPRSRSPTPDGGADIVVVATPDAAIADAAVALAPGLEPGALVLHLSGACTLEELDKLRPGASRRRDRLAAPAAALAVRRGRADPPGRLVVRGRRPRRVERLALSLGMRPFRVARATARPLPRRRDHRLEPPRRAARPGRPHRRRRGRSPPRRCWPLVRATVDNVEALGANDALDRSGRTRRRRHRRPSPRRVARRRAGDVPRPRGRGAVAQRSRRRTARRPARGRRVGGRRPMNTVTTIAELRATCDAARAAGKRVGFVPTMGFFHDGHRSLMRAAARGQRLRRRQPLREPHRSSHPPRTSTPTRATSTAIAPRRRRRASTCCSRRTRPRCTPPARGPRCTSTASPRCCAAPAGPATSTASPRSSPSSSRSSVRAAPTSAARTRSRSRSSGG